MFSMRLRLVSTGLLGLMLLSSCSSTDSSSMTAVAGGAEVLVQAGSEIGGVHNLVLAKEGILMGTHNGVWLQSGVEAPFRAGESRFDAMALSVYADGLIASGHPDSSEEQVGSLGLRKSADGGKTWSSISLYGVADFHRLAASGSSIIGLASGSLVRSDDLGMTWFQLPNPNIFDFALNPKSSDQIIATTESGLILSTDGGENFSIIPEAPFLALLSWDSNLLSGVSPEGVVHESIDNGSSWREVGTVPGSPRAFSSLDNEMVILVEGTVYYSNDAGESFTERVTGVPGH